VAVQPVLLGLPCGDAVHRTYLVCMRCRGSWSWSVQQQQSTHSEQQVRLATVQHSWIWVVLCGDVPVMW
jgi:hypothetical protein